MLKRLDLSQPFGPKNWYWADPVSSEGVGAGTKAERAAYAREWRKQNPLLAKNSYLKKRYGITIAQYEEMLNLQQGGCAICGKKDVYYNLAVDHCHSSGSIRSLLCSACNTGLGSFRDRIDLLEAAITYLRAHQKQTA